MKKRIPRRRRIAGGTLGLALIAVLGMTIFGSASSLASTSHATAAAYSARDIAVAHAYVGGSLGKATKSPIEVGFVANNTGPTGQPYLTVADSNALQLINDHLDGVDGHRIVFVKCNFGGTAQQGQNCGTEFANNAAIKLVLFPGGTVGGAQLHAAIGGSKVVLCTIAGPADFTAKNTFCTTGGTATTGAIATYLKEYVKASSVSILSITDPTLEAVLAQEKAQYAQLGIAATIGFTDPGATDVTAPLVAAGVQSTDATLLELPLSSVCAPYAKALTTLGVTKPVISLGTCNDPSVENALGYLPKWTYFDYGPSAELPDPTGEVRVFLDANKVNHDDGSGQNATQSFGTTLLMAKIMDELGPGHLTTAAIAAKLSAYTGPAFLGDPKLKFGVQPFPAAGSTRARFFTYLGNGKWKDATGGKFISAP